MPPLTRRQFIGAAAALAVAGNRLALPARALTVHPRSSWAPDLPPKGPLSLEDVRFLIVHHSASHNGHVAADVPGILRGWYHYHTGPDKGWPDIAYNFIIDSEGGIWEGREGSIESAVAGSATGGNQGFTQLVCVIGDTNLAPATAKAQASLVSTLAWLADRYDVSTAPAASVTFISRGSNRWPEGTSVTTPTIAGHRDMSKTSCPGDTLYGYVTGSLSADVESARGGPAPAPPPSTTTTTSPTTTALPTTTTTTIQATTMPPTTTIAPPSTTTPFSSTSIESARSSVTSSIPAPTTTLPVAVATLPDQTGTPAGLLVSAGAMVATGAGLLWWRYRRMAG